MTRHEQREQVFKLLFRVEFNSIEDMPEQVRLFFNGNEDGMTEKDEDFVEERYKIILQNLSEIDKNISEHTEGWDITRVGKVELTVLRIAVYEMLFDKDIPDGVAINEAVEIAKKYGQENSGAFVNAILAKFVKHAE